MLLTSGVFQLLDGIGHDAYTPQETGALLNHPPPPPHTHTLLLTSGVFQLLDGIGHDAHASQETGSLLLVNLLVVPYTDRDGILASKVSGKLIVIKFVSNQTFINYLPTLVSLRNLYTHWSINLLNLSGPFVNLYFQDVIIWNHLKRRLVLSLIISVWFINTVFKKKFQLVHFAS